MRSLDSAEQPEYSQLSIAGFLELAGQPKPAPAAGSVAALTLALSCSLCSKAAKLSVKYLSRAGELATLALELEKHSLELADEDALSYARVTLARRAKREESGIIPESSKPQADILEASAYGASPGEDIVNEALIQASHVPMTLASLGVSAGEIAAQLASEGNPNLLGDCTSAVFLADAAVRSAVFLAETNLSEANESKYSGELKALIQRSSDNVKRATSTIPVSAEKALQP